MLKGLVLLVAMLTASGLALMEASGPEAQADQTPSNYAPQYEVVSPEIVRLAPHVDGPRLAALRDVIVRQAGMMETDLTDGSRSVASRVDETHAWDAEGAADDEVSQAVRTITTFDGADGRFYRVETVETPGHQTLVLLSATNRTGESSQTAGLLLALRGHFTPIAPVRDE
jgi:hypothetical protein